MIIILRVDIYYTVIHKIWLNESFTEQYKVTSSKIHYRSKDVVAKELESV